MLNIGFPASLIATVVPNIGRDPVGWMQSGLEPFRLSRPSWISLRKMFPDQEVWRTVFGYSRLVHLFVGGLTLADWGISDLGPYDTKEQRLELADWVVRPPPGINYAAMAAIYDSLK